jgi:hypothetical protein
MTDGGMRSTTQAFYSLVRSRMHALTNSTCRDASGVANTRADTPPLTCSDGAEDGIRTRDPHLDRVVVFVLLGTAGPPSAGPSAQFPARPLNPALE